MPIEEAGNGDYFHIEQHRAEETRIDSILLAVAGGVYWAYDYGACHEYDVVLATVFLAPPEPREYPAINDESLAAKKRQQDAAAEWAMGFYRSRNAPAPGDLNACARTHFDMAFLHLAMQMASDGELRPGKGCGPTSSTGVAFGLWSIHTEIMARLQFDDLNELFWLLHDIA
ncbi:hypothetical protein GGF31_008264 [Allomyces arbusculus]|nr:hypothetical protein GGF31_008264 [Allomyces arbusculus]